MSRAEIAFAGVLSIAIAMVASPSAVGDEFVVDNTNDSGFGSLRQAMLDANASPGVDLISFNIHEAGIQLILPLSPLPILTDDTVIDGSTQVGFAGTPLIELGGDLAGTADALVSTAQLGIGWLTINGWNGSAVVFNGPGGDGVVAGCYLGVNNDAQGISYPNSGYGVAIIGSAGNIIGASGGSFRNVIAGQLGGIVIQGAASTDNTVQNNYVGVTGNGVAHLPTGNAAISLVQCGINLIGGPDPGDGNVVAGASLAQIGVVQSVPGSTIQGNRVGVNAVGSAPIGAAQYGIMVSATDETLIRDNQVAGALDVNVELRDTYESRVMHNFIGTDAFGTTALGGGAIAGIRVYDSCRAIIGNSIDEVDRNVISGNDGDGILITGSAPLACWPAYNLVLENYIGVGSGLGPLGNGGHGVNVQGIEGVNIGNGEFYGLHAVIAHNGGTGVLVGPEARRVALRRVHIYENGGMSIDLSEHPTGPDGPTPNDPGDADDGANKLQNHPILVEAILDPPGLALTVSGVLDTVENLYIIEVWASPECSDDGGAQGTLHLGKFDVWTDTDGFAAFSETVLLPAALDPSWSITTTARRSSAFGSSEMSPCIPIGPACVGDVPGTPTGVDISDLLAVLSAWGEAGTADVAPPPTGDGIVDINDLLLVLGSWGPCE